MLQLPQKCAVAPQTPHGNVVHADSAPKLSPLAGSTAGPVRRSSAGAGSGLNIHNRQDHVQPASERGPAPSRSHTWPASLRLLPASPPGGLWGGTDTWCTQRAWPDISGGAAHPAGAAHGLVLDRRVCSSTPPVHRPGHPVRRHAGRMHCPQVVRGRLRLLPARSAVAGQHDGQPLVVCPVCKVVQPQPAARYQ